MKKQTTVMKNQTTGGRARVSHETESVTVADWKQLAQVVREPSRRRPGQSVWWVRLAFGTMVPKRCGPFVTEEKARKAFETVTTRLEDDLDLAACDVLAEVAEVGVGYVDEH